MTRLRARDDRDAIAGAADRKSERRAFGAATGFEVRHSFARVAGVTIHWAEVGEATAAPPVVMLHGLQDSHLTWRRVVSSLARDRRVLMPDLPGHGLSERPDATYDLPWYARVTAAWLDTIGLAQADVVGHSLGGGIAQMLLLEHHDRIRRLVLAASGGLGREITTLLRLAAIPYVVERFGQPFFGLGTWVALRGVVAAEDLADLRAMNAQVGSARAFARTVRDLIDWRGQRRTFTQRIHEVAALPPIAVIWGARDRVIPARHAAALAKLVDGLEVTVLDDCGHHLHHEQPESFARIVRKFLDAPVASSVRLRGDPASRPRVHGDEGARQDRAAPQLLRPHQVALRGAPRAERAQHLGHQLVFDVGTTDERVTESEHALADFTKRHGT